MVPNYGNNITSKRYIDICESSAHKHHYLVHAQGFIMGEITYHNSEIMVFK